MKKRCFKCHKVKDISHFYQHRQMGDGYLGKCKSCTKKDAKDRYNDPESRLRITEYERKRFQNPERKKKVNEYQIKRRQTHKGKEGARRKINDLIRSGRLNRLPCEICGDKKSQAHHSDYRKSLDIKWLCFKHHREEHGQKLSIKNI